MLVNVLDYPDAATAIEAATEGDRVYFPGVRNYDAPAAGWQITKSLELFGDGCGSGNGNDGTVLRSDPNPTNAVFVLNAAASGDLSQVYVHDLCITPPGPARSSKEGIRLVSGPVAKLSELRLERVVIRKMDVGLSLQGANATAGAVVGVAIYDSTFADCAKQGVLLQTAYAVECVRSSFVGNQLHGLKILSEEISLLGCVFEDNCGAGGDAQLSAYDDDNIPPIEEVTIFRADACVFRRRNANHLLTGIRLRRVKGGTCIGGCTFEQLVGTPVDVGIEFAAAPLGDSRGAVVVLPNRFAGVASAVVCSGASDFPGLTILPQFVASPSIGIQLPTGLNDAPVGVPSLATSYSALLIPAYAGDPNSNALLGALAFNSATGQLRVYRKSVDGVPGWMNVQTS